VTQPPSASPHSGKWRISSVRRTSAGQPETPTDMSSLFRSFIFASLPLSHAVTLPNATHGPLATSSLSFFLFLLSSLVLRFSTSPFHSFSLLFYDSLQLYSNLFFIFFILLLISLFQ
jgi:hypothetical protein